MRGLRAGVRRLPRRRATSSASPTAPTRSSWRCRRSASAPGDARAHRAVHLRRAARGDRARRARRRCSSTSATTSRIDVDAAAAVLRARPVKAIIAVHLYGQPADLDRLLPLARAHGAALIEDAAQAHGAWCTVAGQRRRAGSIGDAGCFSFYPTKNLGAMGDAGALVDQPRRRRRARPPARQPRRARASTSTSSPNGRNSRLDALQAAVLRVKLPHLDAWNARAPRRRGALRAPASPACRCACRSSAPAASASTTSTPCRSRRPRRAAAARWRRAASAPRSTTRARCTSRRAVAQLGYARRQPAGRRALRRRGAVAADVAVPHRRADRRGRRQRASRSARAKIRPDARLAATCSVARWR